MTRYLLVLLLFVSAAVQATPPLPDSPPGRVLGEWLAAFNSANAAEVESFNKTWRQEGEAAETVDWRNQTGGYDLSAVELDEPGKAVVRFRDRRDPDEEVRATATLAGAGTAPVLEFEPVEIPRRTQAEAIAALAKRVNEFAEAGEFSGAVLVARHDEVLLRRAWGEADRARQIANTPETRFRLGSANKMFTAVAVMQLVEAGKLSLDGSIHRYLPDFPDAAVAKAITLRDLLTHQSGLVDIEFSDSEGVAAGNYPAIRDALRTHADYVARYGARAPLSKPRGKIEYNSFGFVVLGAIIERVSGGDYYDYVEQNIFRPAGMASTGSLPETDDVPGRSRGYTLRDGNWVDNGDTLPWRGTAAGGGYSTVDDLHRFARALLDGKLLSPAGVAELTKPQISENWYGYGFITVGKGPLRRFGHGGDAPGMNADLRIFPESGYVLVSLSNIDPPAAYRVFRYYEPRMPVVP